MTAVTWAKTRVESRAQVLPIEVKGLLAKGSQMVPFFVWDVSARGIGLLLSDPFDAGDIVTLNFGALNLTIPCLVQWCALQESDYDFQEASFRIGLIAKQPGDSFQGLLDHIQSLS
jgi:hypothetical protein